MEIEYWTVRGVLVKTIRSRPKPMRQPQTLLLCHGYLSFSNKEPGRRARQKQIMAQMRKKAPRMSIFLIFPLKGSFVASNPRS